MTGAIHELEQISGWARLDPTHVGHANLAGDQTMAVKRVSDGLLARQKPFVDTPRDAVGGDRSGNAYQLREEKLDDPRFGCRKGGVGDVQHCIVRESRSIAQHPYFARTHELPEQWGPNRPGVDLTTLDISDTGRPGSTSGRC